MASISAILLKFEELCPYGSILKKGYYVLQFMHMQVQSGLNFKILMEHLAKLNLKLISKHIKANFQG
jgi:hypothetical protein